MSRPLSGAVASSTSSPRSASRTPRSRSATSRSPSSASTGRVDPAERADLAPRERPLGDEQEGLEVPDGDLRGLAIGSLTCPQLRRPSEACVGRLGRAAAGSDASHGDGSPRLRLLDDQLAALDQLQHGEERDRDDDPVPDTLEQVLEHHRGCDAQRIADDPRPVGERHHARHDGRRLLERERQLDPAPERRDQRLGVEARRGRRHGARARRRERDGGLPVERRATGRHESAQEARRVAVALVLHEPGAERLLGVATILARCGGLGLSRQQRPALDEDELRGDRHEGADVRQLVARPWSRSRRDRSPRARRGAPSSMSSCRCSMSDRSSARGPRTRRSGRAPPARGGHRRRVTPRAGPGRVAAGPGRRSTGPVLRPWSLRGRPPHQLRMPRRRAAAPPPGPGRAAAPGSG